MRLRFAPSPTGFLHIGNARTAIINHLVAKKYGAEYILRVEDTDFERSTRESEISILNDLKWLGIEWTEGPDMGGSVGPYRQSERFDIYKSYTDRLISEGKAYYCYCSEPELDAMREEASRKNETFEYPGKCLGLSEKDIAEKKSAGIKPTVRFRVPRNIDIEFDDLIREKVSFNSNNIGGDFIIVRSDGVPVYNYLVVIDDFLMKVTNVIRGEDHLSNTPKQILIAKALGINHPVYAHLPLVLGNDKKKLSKRHGITSVDLFRKEGYLPEALVNYIAMLGWATSSGEEILAVDQIVSEIDMNSLAKSAAVFDFQKLRWMNSIYIRNYDPVLLLSLFRPYINEVCNMDSLDAEWLNKVVSIIKTRCEVLSDIKKYIKPFIEEIPALEEEAEKVVLSEEGKKIISTAHELIGSIEPDDFMKNIVSIIKEKTKLGGKKLFMPIRVMLTFEVHGPELNDIIPLIGFDRCRKRIEHLFNKYSGA